MNTEIKNTYWEGFSVKNGRKTDQRKEIRKQYPTTLWKTNDQIVQINTPEITSNEIIQIKDSDVGNALKEIK